MEEKRQFPRYACSVEVEYSPKGNGVVYSQTVSKNISRGGICMPVLPRMVRTGDTIDLDIYPTGDRRNIISAKGEVVWTKETSATYYSSSTNTEAGIKFTSVNDDALEQLLRMVQ